MSNCRSRAIRHRRVLLRLGSDDVDPYADYLVYNSFTGDNDDNVHGRTPPEQAPAEATWSVEQGAMTIQSNEAVFNTTVGEKQTVIDAGAADVEIQALVRCGSSFCPGVVLRYVDINHYFMMQLHKGEQKLYIKEDLNGYSARASKAWAINENDEFLVKVVASGTSIQLYINGNLELEWTSSNNLNATEHGLWCNVPGVGPGETDYLWIKPS